MRIGILTLPLHTNYGGILQAYALQTVLERLEHEVIVYQKKIHPPYSLPLWKYPLAYGKRGLKKLLFDKRTIIFREQKNKKENSTICKELNRFIETYIHTKMINRPRDIDLSSVDCIVVGSDQIWRPYHVKKLFNADITEAFLYFANKWKGQKIAYAISFGVEKWEFSKKQTEKCKYLATLFDAISVREESAISMCSLHLGVSVQHVLDPTLLLTPDDYNKLLNNRGRKNDNKILFCYILDETQEKLALIDKVSKKLCLEPYLMGVKPHDTYAPLNERILPAVEDWLTFFYNADYVVTDSFHGCVFSIIYHKPFIAIGNPERGMSRFNSLLKKFGLENHLYRDVKNIDNIIIPDCLGDYDNILSLEREKSINFLRYLLNNN